MKPSFLLSFLLWILLGAVLPAQNHVRLHLAPRLGDQPFALDEVTPGNGYYFKVARLQYYVSEITITHDGGQVLPLTDLWLLVNPATDSIYDLGVLDIEQVESIKFSLGVDPDHNHLDPASYPAGHPLAPQNPSMHWGWAAGYRFIAFEGLAGGSATNPNNVFEIHSLNDGNYKTLTLSTGAELVGNTLTIHLKADYKGLLTGINVGGGVISHGSGGASATLMNNLKNVVFSSQTSGIIDPAFTGSFRVMPNPAPSGISRLSYELHSGLAYTLTLTDLNGRLLFLKTLAAGSQSVALDGPNLNAGVYFLHLWQDNQPVAVEKLVISE
jgi:hypothetical protein